MAIRNTIDSGHTRQRPGRALCRSPRRQIGLARGLRVRRAIVSPLNPAAAVTTLFNHAGALSRTDFACTIRGKPRRGYSPDPSTPIQLAIRLQINAQQLRRCSEDVPARVRLIDRPTMHALDALYQETPWRVVAALPDHFCRRVPNIHPSIPRRVPMRLRPLLRFVATLYRRVPVSPSPRCCSSSVGS